MLSKIVVPQTPPPFSTVGYLTYKRTYSRKLDDDSGKTEEFHQSIIRVIDAAETQLGCGFTSEERQRIFDYMYNLKGSVAGRFLWQLGTHTVDTLGLASLQNCAATLVDHPVRPFTWAMDLLMLGAGCGYNIQREHVNKIPKVNKGFVAPQRVDNASADFIVPDTREGWVQLLGKTLKAAFIAREKKSFTYSTQLVRGRGAPIKGFGGVASGAEDLCNGIDKISAVLAAREGRKVRPIDCLDIMNIIGEVVVAGNVRRSAQLAIGDCDDVEFLLAKRWDIGSIPSWRAMSNNSVACDDINDLHDFFWETYKGNSEPYGLINMRLSRECGRIGDVQYPDPRVVAYNPCVSGDTLVLTDQGFVRIDGMLDQSVNVWNGFEFSETTPKITGTNQEMLTVTLNDGNYLRCTKYHTWVLEDGTRILAQNLQVGDALLDHCYPDGSFISGLKVSSIVESGIEETVYCFTELLRGQGCFKGIVTGQCAEQSLEEFETCCLAEIFLSRFSSKEELLDAVKLFYRINKHSLALPCHHPETQKVVNDNMRMGIGVTGYMEATKQQIGWLSDVYEELRKFDVEYSALHGFPVSIKLTTCKPSGTLSLLPGVTPGAHPAYARYMIRRIRLSSDSPLVQVCKDHGYPVEFQLQLDGGVDHSTVVVSFPFRYSDNAVLAAETTAIDQLKVVKQIQTLWSDNSVSCTVYYKPEELPEIKKYLKRNYATHHKTLSFLLHQEHGFKQAPFEEITKEQYDDLVATTRIITSVDGVVDFEGDNECISGSCPIK